MDPSSPRKRRAVRGIEFGCSIAASSTESAEFGGMGFEEEPLSALQGVYGPGTSWIGVRRHRGRPAPARRTLALRASSHRDAARIELSARARTRLWTTVPVAHRRHQHQSRRNSRVTSVKLVEIQGWKLRRHGCGGLGGSRLRSDRRQGARSTAGRIVLRPKHRYQALRLRRTAARLRGLTAALRPPGLAFMPFDGAVDRLRG